MADVSQIKLPNGSVYDLIDEKSGYITADYIENKTDYEIPVSRVGEIVVGETAIGTDSTNFPTSKAVVDYVDERVVQEMDAIDVGVTGIKADGTSLAIESGIVNIPVIGKNQSVGLITVGILNNIYSEIPTSTSQLTNDSGFITASDVPTSTSQLTNDSGFITSDSDERLAIDLFTHSSINSATYYPILGVSGNSISTAARRKYDSEFKYEFINGTTVDLSIGSSKFIGRLSLKNNNITTRLIPSATSQANLTLPNKTGTIALTSDIPTVPTNISSFTNDSGYLTASDIASVMTYKGTKANYAALPSTGNTTGDVWHLTDTGAEWAWDGSTWQELGTAIDLSNYLTTSDIAAWAKASTKPTYTAAEVGALPDSTIIPSKTSELTNDSGFITSYTDEKLKLEEVTERRYYYPIVGINTATSIRQFDTSGFKYFSTIGTTSATGRAEILLGNTTQSGTEGNKSGYITLYSSEGASNTLASAATGSNNNYIIYIPSKTGTVALTSDIPDTSSFLTSETDPVFSASAAAGITSTDISNWNAKVSDDKTWNGITLNKQYAANNGTVYVPMVDSTSDTNAYYMQASSTPGTSILAKYDVNSYLKSTTPSANDNSTKVATTAYVDSAIGGITVPTKTSDLTNDSGFITSYTDEKVKLTSTATSGSYPIIFGPTSITSGSTYSMNYNSNIVAVPSEGRLDIKRILIHWTDWDTAYVKLNMSSIAGNAPDYYLPTLKFESGAVNTSGGTDKLVRIRGIQTPTDLSINNMMDYVATVKYVNDSIPKVYSSTNTGGYLTMATLPIYDGTVE